MSRPIQNGAEPAVYNHGFQDRGRQPIRMGPPPIGFCSKFAVNRFLEPGVRHRRTPRRKFRVKGLLGHLHQVGCSSSRPVSIGGNPYSPRIWFTVFSPRRSARASCSKRIR